MPRLSLSLKGVQSLPDATEVKLISHLKTTLTRREFLNYSALGFISILGTYSFRLKATEGEASPVLLVGAQKSACLINLKENTLKKLEVGFSPHSFIQSSPGSSQFIVIEKWGPHAAFVDFKSDEIKNLESGVDHMFYGHGVLDPKKNSVLIARVDTKTRLGHLIRYDLKSLKQEEDYQVTPGGLHDCHWLPDGSLMIASSGIRKDTYAIPQKGTRVAPSSLIRVDLEKRGGFLSELSLSDLDQVLAHFAVAKSGAILALSGPIGSATKKHGGLYYSGDGREPLRSLSWDVEIEKMLKDEMLSIALNKDESRAAITNPVSGIISLVDMKQGLVIKTMHEPFHSLAFDPAQNAFLGGYTKLAYFDDQLGPETPVPLETHDLFDGAHSLMTVIAA